MSCERSPTLPRFQFRPQRLVWYRLAQGDDHFEHELVVAAGVLDARVRGGRTDGRRPPTATRPSWSPKLTGAPGGVRVEVLEGRGRRDRLAAGLDRDVDLAGGARRRDGPDEPVVLDFERRRGRRRRTAPACRLRCCRIRRPRSHACAATRHAAVGRDGQGGRRVRAQRRRGRQREVVSQRVPSDACPALLFLPQ